MRGSGSVVAVPLAIASSAAILATAYSDPPPSGRVQDPKPDPQGQGGGRSDGDGRRGADPTDRFAPRFDGLRFIETLVTAHR
ncbi:uncharacterized protein M6B38_262825 [Iris pallida]|uniref:Uncharacterized protein n=1 Tax=Iris pallida TaxID=29817 RepID=A0AAX6GW88_IRIPA|nr:uncharacterized protein M6B38_125265 [Iris pallida]KAJ6832775.1 uncharacterized protein M6B38_125270 [Iris pallida]KAJ6851033.1 uncharacterized protein M6B38_262825 [Iris pallida]